MRHMLVALSVTAGCIALVCLIVYFCRPKLLWYADAEFSASWTRILNEAGPPVSRYEVIARAGNEPFPNNRFGFVVSRKGPRGEPVEGAPVVMYPNLSRSLTFGDWFALAADPWMVFRKHQYPEPGRPFLDRSNERGSILLAGVDPAAVTAWLARLLQESSGVFARGDNVWHEKGQSLVQDYPFQSGAFTYSRVQTWPLLFRSERISLYAPLSQARAYWTLPVFRSRTAGSVTGCRLTFCGRGYRVRKSNAHNSPKRKHGYGRLKPRPLLPGYQPILQVFHTILFHGKPKWHGCEVLLSGKERVAAHIWNYSAM